MVSSLAVVDRYQQHEIPQVSVQVTQYDRLQEHVHAAVVPRRQRASRDPVPGDDAPMPGGAARSGTSLRTQASATSGVDRSAKAFSMAFSLTWSRHRRWRVAAADGAVVLPTISSTRSGASPRPG